MKYKLTNNKKEWVGVILYQIEASKRERHGMRYTRIYAIWCGVKSRCLNPRSKDYKNYGAKGIGMSKDWERFSCFLQDMGSAYHAHSLASGEFNTTIERINNNEGYSKENCRWATRAEQNRNKTYGWEKLHRGAFGRFAKIAELKEQADNL